MKIVYEKEDVGKVLGMLNSGSFVGTTAPMYNTMRSNEAWGLPVFTNLKFKNKADIWKSPVVKKALANVNTYMKKKGWRIAKPQEISKLKTAFFGYLEEPDAIAKGTVCHCYEPKFITVNGITMATALCDFETRKAIAASNAAGGGAFGGVIGSMVAGAGTMGMIGGAIGGAVLGAGIGLLLSKLWKKGYGIYVSYIPFVKKNNKLVWKRFGVFLVENLKNKATPVSSGTENYKNAWYSLEAGNDEIDVDMDALVKDEECPIEDAGEDSETVDVSDISETTAAHNEAASAGGIAVGDNVEDITMDPITGTESLLFNNFLFSKEELDETVSELENTEVEVAEVEDTSEDDELASVGVDVDLVNAGAAEVADIGDTNVAANVLPDGETVDVSEEALQFELLGWNVN